MKAKQSTERVSTKILSTDRVEFTVKNDKGQTTATVQMSREEARSKGLLTR